MKLKNIIPLLMLLLTSTLFAQGGVVKQKKEQLKSMKIAFITSAVGLTSAEAQKFWPLYNSFDEKQFQLRQQKSKAFQQRMNDGSVNEMSDKEASDFLKQMEDNEQELFDLRKRFNASLRNVLSPIKIIKLKKAEEDFNRKLLKQYRNRAKK
ncbi:MAG TPA: sensor of ECF-type sigma factor [Flavobacterium sp.]|jgi:Spy/CpxP family protein refolding chaperone